MCQRHLLYANASSEQWGSESNRGKYAVKIYTIDGVLIYQEDTGRDNTGKTPLGGVIVQGSPSSSMIDAIANPITFYGGSGSVITQDGHSRDLYDYYWTSYSRGTDGRRDPNDPLWHNVYLDGYIPLRAKSIYDPCPYSYRIPSNGTYNQFTNLGWTHWSYLGGVSWDMNTLCRSWFLGFGYRNPVSSYFEYTGRAGYYFLGSVSFQTSGYTFEFNSSKGIYLNRHDLYRSFGTSVRCIELAALCATMIQWN